MQNKTLEVNMIKRILAWLKNWLVGGGTVLLRDQVMTTTKNRGPKKMRYRKLRCDIGKKVSYCIPYGYGGLK
jgi:hypothetical protein